MPDCRHEGKSTAIIHADYTHAFAGVHECADCGKRITIVQAREGHALSDIDESAIRVHVGALLELSDAYIKRRREEALREEVLDRATGLPPMHMPELDDD